MLNFSLKCAVFLKVYREYMSAVVELGAGTGLLSVTSRTKANK